ncbi:hypothetical protein SPF06_03560 [Sinomonas sp. JGH33]|uniref:Lipoprotein n=1 Tax=Sinomonas terricola TaxID=3110330 RepID=A0ABU5T2U5_9MICC|nr:hypothetical protein [Sinomonas sp. JGH33]MEA5453791.1 hypothetical protein [Sinomonas sp. JGH33]
MHRSARLLGAVLAAVLSVGSLAGCAYSYGDGLPPLGSRSTPSTSPAPSLRFPRQRDPLPPSSGVTEAPPESWTPDMLASWAEATVPDASGISLAFGYGLALSDQPVLATAAVPIGTLVVEYACRGADAARLTLSVAGTALIDSDYTCGRLWVRTIVIEKESVAEVRSAPAGTAPAAYAFRIVMK